LRLYDDALPQVYCSQWDDQGTTFRLWQPLD
jgi:hypothetical protein